MLNLVLGRNKGEGFIATHILENVQEKMSEYRNKIIETEEIINTTPEGENVFERLRECKGNREERQEDLAFFSIEREIMQECSESDRDKKQWGKSKVFEGTKWALFINTMRNGIKRFSNIWGIDKPLLDKAREDIFCDDESNGKKSILSKNFEEDLKVEKVSTEKVSDNKRKLTKEIEEKDFTK